MFKCLYFFIKFLYKKFLMNSKSHNIYSNPLLRRKMVVKHTTTTSSKPSSKSSSSSNNIETFILGTTETKSHNKQEEINNFKKLAANRQRDDEQFKDKTKYLQNIPYKAIHGQEAFNKKINTEQDLVLCNVSNTRRNKAQVEKQIAKTINERKQFDLEQRSKFSKNQEVHYKQEFDNELNNRFKNISVSQSDSSELKKDSYKYHEKCQQELEKNKEDVDQIINQLMESEGF